jgi:biotin synthase
MNLEEQALCFMAGANSIFAGDKLLTTANPEYVKDQEMFQHLQLKARPSNKQEKPHIHSVAAH